MNFHARIHTQSSHTLSHTPSISHTQNTSSQVNGITQQFCSITGEDQICLLSPYPASNSIQTRRASARRIGSTYAYDFLGLMEVGR